MNYNQTKMEGGNVMPLIMGCTQPSKIEVIENEAPVIYDPISQTVTYNTMPTVCTRSKLPGVTGTCANNRDFKSGNDDWKIVTK